MSETDMPLTYPKRDCVHEIESCRLIAHEGTWAYARSAAAEIDAAWANAQRTNPKFFNGTVYLLDAVAYSGRRLDARLLRSDFKSYLYWRRNGFPETGVRDGFGSALIRAADGAYLLGRQRAGNVNAGLVYLPGGFIDGRDVAADGTIDIAASITRELEEETGLTSADVEALPGFLATENGPHLSIAKTFQSSLASDALKAHIERHIAADAASELECIVIVRTARDLDGLAMPSYVGVLLSHLMGG